MGDVVNFRRAKLTGFIPEGLGEEDAQRRRNARRAGIQPWLAAGRDAGSISDLVTFAKTGGPIIDADTAPSELP